MLAGAIAGIATGGINNLGKSGPFPTGGVYQFGCPSGLAFAACPEDSKIQYEGAVIGSCPDNIEYVWRATVGTGVIPAVIALVLSKYLLVETPRFTAHVKKDHLRAITDLASQGEPYAALVANAIDFDGTVIPTAEADLTCCGFVFFHGWNLTSVSLCWFLFNIAFYGFIIATRDASAIMGFTHIQYTQSAIDLTQGTIKTYVALVVASIIPGYYVTALTVDLIGRKLLQFLGFVLFAIFLAGLAGGRPVLLNPNNRSQYDLTPDGQNATNMSYYNNVKSNGFVAIFVFFTCRRMLQ